MDELNAVQPEQTQTTEPKKLMSLGDLIIKSLNSSIKLFHKVVAITGIIVICMLVIVGLGVGMVFLLKNTLGLTASIILSACTFGLLAAYFVFWWYPSIVVLVCGVDNGIKIKDVLKKGWKFTMPYLVVSCWAGLIGFSGIVCLIIPGVIYMIWFLFAPFVLVCENIRGRLALVRSKNLVKNYWWPVFGRFVVILILGMAISMLFILLEGKPPHLNIFWLIVRVFINIFLAIFNIIFIYLIYKNLYEIKGAASTEELKGFPKNWSGWLFSIIGIVGFVAYIWIISTIMFKYSGLIKKSQEGTAKAYTGTLRCAITIYYGETEGKYPVMLDALVPKYIDEIPTVKLGDKNWSGEEKNTWKLDPTMQDDITVGDIDDSTTWIYNNNRGIIKLNKSGTDTKGKKYYEW